MDSQDTVERIGDIWALLYYHLATGLLDEFGMEGERALRRGIRLFGRQRGLTMRARHLQEGRPITLRSLFEHYDLPSDGRSGRNTHILTDEERVSETTACPYAQIWSECDPQGDVGRIYCEEIHHAIFSAYDPAIQTNLTSTITRGDPVCRFAVHLRQANQGTTEYVVQRHVRLPYEDDPPAMMTDLWILLYFHLARQYVDTFGDVGDAALRHAIRAFGEDRGRRMRRAHEEQGLPINVHTLFSQRDQPSDARTQSQLIVLTEDEWQDHVYRCAFFEAWRDQGGLDVGLIYCQEVHHAMWEAYDPHMEVHLPQALTAKDNCCQFRVFWKQLSDKTSGAKPGVNT